MMKSKNVVAALRRDVHFVWNAVIAVVFIGFASLAVAAALLDLLAIRHIRSHSRTARRIAMPPPVEILDHDMLAAVATRAREIVRADRRFAVAARNIEHVARLTQAGQAPAQAAHQILSGRDVGAQMAGAGRQIAVMQVVRLDAAFDQRAHQLAKHFRRVVDAGQQHRLRQQRNAGIGHARDRPRAPAGVSSRGWLMCKAT